MQTTIFPFHSQRVQTYVSPVKERVRHKPRKSSGIVIRESHNNREHVKAGWGKGGSEKRKRKKRHWTSTPDCYQHQCKFARSLFDLALNGCRWATSTKSLRRGWFSPHSRLQTPTVSSSWFYMLLQASLLQRSFKKRILASESKFCPRAFKDDVSGLEHH